MNLHKLVHLKRPNQAGKVSCEETTGILIIILKLHLECFGLVFHTICGSTASDQFFPFFFSVMNNYNLVNGSFQSFLIKIFFTVTNHRINLQHLP